MLIGITGGIGSGKSTIANELRRLGYDVYDTDAEAKRLMNEDPMLKEQLLASFGTLDRAELSRLVFADANASSNLHRLNSIVHPAVFRDLTTWAANKTLCFAESAILFESGMDKICDKTIAVTAPLEVRIKRTMARDNATRESVLERINKQMTDAERTSRADFSINYEGIKKVSAHCKQILSYLN